MIDYTVHVPAVPVAQPRPRATRTTSGHARIHEVTHVKGSDGTRRMHPIAAFKASVRMATQSVHTGAPLDIPLRIDVTFVFPRPDRLIWKTKPMPRVPHTGKPDRDNCDKAVLDALKGTLFVDDSQVCCGYLEKWVASGYEQPHVMLRIRDLEAVSRYVEAAQSRGSVA